MEKEEMWTVEDVTQCMDDVTAFSQATKQKLADALQV